MHKDLAHNRVSIYKDDKSHGLTLSIYVDEL